MKFLTLEVENFMALANAKVELDQRGLVLIQGVNAGDSSAASNGAGKSTLMNSLMWCIYGETSHGVKGDDVLSTGHEKNCRVKVTIEDEGKRYAIIRHRKHKEFKNRLIVRGEDGDMTKGKDSLTQEFVERLIGASKEVFMASIYASQEAMPDLPGMSDKNLKTIVEEAAGVDRLTKAYAIARERANAAAARMETTKTKMDACLSLVESAQNELESAKTSSEAWERDRSERLDVARADLVGAEVTLTEVEMELRSLPEQIRDTENAIGKEREKLASKEEHDAKLVKVRGAITDIRASIRITENIQKEAMQRARAFKVKAEEVNTKVGEPCPTCGKAYCVEDLSTVKESFVEQARSEISQAQASATSVAKYQEHLEKALKIESSLVASTPDVSAIISRIEQLTKELGTLRHREKEVVAVEALVARARSEVDRITKEINPFLAVIKRHEESLAANKSNYGVLKTELKNIQEQALLLDKARQVYSPAGVRSHILTSVTPFLNAQTAEYLNTLSDGNIVAEWSTMESTKKGEWRDKFNISVRKIGASKTFQTLSGGEKRKVRIACSLALQDLVASRASKNIELFIGDEIDDALDTAGLERLMGILEAKARERGTVMIISHKEMKSWFRETITVEVKEGRSYVV
ncbi:AAA family ATPase [Raoultella ornithinolytica]|jgi:DNA repair exonuclease SbcCD ATPase subunit|uniref:AAA family ATPase n=1 Tax=Klebsiella/Raoultella group TaxID=2890311 RepID=UPI000B3FD867|nr:MULTISPECIES: AAA family ATPase [Klebsiella]EKT9524196.1 AAA family ATPase [Raoultella ornithinolytica]ELK0758898.1 AAA family ATPase [Klebsiella oxytoca]HBW8929340.1 AAA family ATPase [Klebsiella pneumoniae subsp. pneumoniae 1158]HBZ7247375.1 AAA family ATPase [Klebsiella variicola subsp. variicola]HCI6931553.1 AAA family ATPase [Klebsiella quasipneumoniae subsp. quasipneumoniae]HCM6591457.1 AAA family ATPase [Klebsiella quasipneumoniae]HDS5674858.1 AAA family ATPase [Klebsiella pneumoni